jgi:signal transduction histidine kinase/ActR/RegA family two-component response regulator
VNPADLVRRSIRLKVLSVVLAATFVALLFTGIILVLYDLVTQRRSAVNDLVAQAEIVGLASAPALDFNDSLAASQNLAVLRVRPHIVAAALYNRQGRLFATYVRDAQANVRFATTPGATGVHVDGGHILVNQPISDRDERLGTVVIDARLEVLPRLWSYIGLVALVLLASLLLALVMSSILQRTITRPILSIAAVAKRVKTERDYSLRAQATTPDETGELVNEFNDMLAQTEARTRLLEETNRALEHEMIVRQDAERALVEADRRKDEFLATLAHELRNPLGPIRNSVHYLRLRHSETEELQQTLSLVERQVWNMVRLIDDLLDISRITRDTLELRRSSFRVDDLIQDVVEATQHAIDEAGHQLEIKRAGGNVWLHADRPRLGQAVINLLNNAIKYTPGGGCLELEAGVHGTELVITVRDNGIGIPPDKLEDIFQPFSQLDRSLEKTRGGLGIGLALAQRLAVLHGGRITASSAGPDQGSTFELRAPVVDREGGELTPSMADRLPKGKTAQPRRVLIADDNHDAAESLAALLEAFGHRTAIAHDGIEVLEQCEKNRFDLAVIDIGMPRLNGYEAARRLRETPEGRAMRLVALTGWGQAEDRQRAFEAGFDEHLTKPIRPDQLVALLAGTPVLDGANPPEPRT